MQDKGCTRNFSFRSTARTSRPNAFLEKGKNKSFNCYGRVYNHSNGRAALGGEKETSELL